MSARSEARSVSERIRIWRKDPVQFVKDNFKPERIDPWQVTALRAFASDDPIAQRIAMKAAKGPGKTAVLAWMIWNFMACYASIGEHPKGKATGITEQNLDDNLWPELSKWQQRSPYLTAAFVWSKSRIFAKDHPETWFFAKQAWPKSGDTQAQANTMAGLHGKYILFVFDESGGIPTPVMATAEAGLANAAELGAWAKIVQAGNPTHLEGPLWDACGAHAHLWTVIEITGDPDDPARSSRISLTWARQQIELYGADNPWVLVNVFGRFPPSSLNALLGPDEVRLAMRRELDDSVWSWAQRRMGIDCARFGDDRTCIFQRQGLNARFTPEVIRKQRTTEIAGHAQLILSRWGGPLVQCFVDGTGGWGMGVVDNLLAAGYNAMDVQFHHPAYNRKYANRRAEMWMAMAEWVKRGGALPNVPELVAELTTPTYTFKQGVFVIEDKDLIKARLGRSPDLAEALVLTFGQPEMPGTEDVPPALLRRRNSTLSEWDPLADLAFSDQSFNQP